MILNPIRPRTIGDNEVHRMSCIQERRKDLPTVLHRPSGNLEFKSVILVQPDIGVGQFRRRLRSGVKWNAAETPESGGFLVR